MESYESETMKQLQSLFSKEYDNHMRNKRIITVRSGHKVIVEDKRLRREVCSRSS